MMTICHSVKFLYVCDLVPSKVLKLNYLMALLFKLRAIKERRRPPKHEILSKWEDPDYFFLSKL